MTRARYPLTTTVLPVLAGAVLLLAGAAQAQTISKCQDAEGNWHYGDFAAEACAEESTITEIDERGNTVDESDAPPTKEELEAQKAAKEQERLEAERQARREAEDRRLLNTYDSVQAIIAARDDRVSALEQELESHRLFRQDLIDEKKSIQDEANEARVNKLDGQIQEYDQAIERLEEERREVVEKYNHELERYRALTGG